MHHNIFMDFLKQISEGYKKIEEEIRKFSKNPITDEMKMFEYESSLSAAAKVAEEEKMSLTVKDLREKFPFERWKKRDALLEKMAEYYSIEAQTARMKAKGLEYGAYINNRWNNEKDTWEIRTADGKWVPFVFQSGGRSYVEGRSVGKTYGHPARNTGRNLQKNLKSSLGEVKKCGSMDLLRRNSNAGTVPAKVGWKKGLSCGKYTTLGKRRKGTQRIPFEDGGL